MEKIIYESEMNYTQLIDKNKNHPKIEQLKEYFDDYKKRKTIETARKLNQDFAIILENEMFFDFLMSTDVVKDLVDNFNNKMVVGE